MSSSARRRERIGDGDHSRRAERDNTHHDESYRMPRVYDSPDDGYRPPEEEFANLHVSQAIPTVSSGIDRGRDQDEELESDWGEWSEYVWTDQDNGYWYSTQMNSRGEYNYRYDYLRPSPVSNTSASTTTPENNVTYSTNFNTPIGSHYESQPLRSPSLPRDDNYTTYQTPLLPVQYGSNFAQSDPSTYIPSGTSYDVPGALTTEYGQNTSGSDAHLSPMFGETPFSGCRCGIKDGLCGVILIPPSKDAKKEKNASTSKSGKQGKSSSSTNKSTEQPKKSDIRQSSKNSKQSDCLHVTGPNGDNCGPLTEPAITPRPEPKLPKPATPEEKERYNRDKKKWDSGYKKWKDITCRCGLGYFNTDGLWISGADVEAGKKPRNPNWKGGRAPSVIDKERRYEGELFEREGISHEAM